MLSGVSLQNFRAHRSVDLSLAPLTALVGSNGSGKSAVLRAIDLLLGERWPSLASLRLPQDFTDFETASELKIEVAFVRPILCEPDALGKQTQIHQLRVTCKPYKNTGKWGASGDPNFDFDALDSLGERPMICHSIRKGAKPDFRPLLGVSAELRRQAPAVLIDHHRSVMQQMPWTRGSVLLKLLDPARREIEQPHDGSGKTRRDVFNERFGQAMEVLRTPHVASVEQVINTTTQRTLGFLGRTYAKDVSIGFGIADPSNPLNSFRLVYREGTREIPAEEAGLGVQSAIVVGLFEALRRTRQQAGIVLIDEPEMYLHPQAQRYFHKLLVEIAESGQAQVIYSTHSPVFAEAHQFETLRILRRESGGYTSARGVSPDAISSLERDRIKLLASHDSGRSEALFADGVLLVEGPGDQFAARETAKQMSIDLDAENLSVIACGGKTAIPFHARLCQALGIPVCVLFDDDLVDEPSDEDTTSEAGTARENNIRARRESAAIEAAIPSRLDRFVCRPSLEKELGIAGGRDKPARVLAKVRDSPDLVPDALRNAVARLADLVDSGPVPF